MTPIRNDIAVVVTPKGIMVVLQGAARYKFRGEIADYEDGLYFSQLVHRSAWYDNETKRYKIGYASKNPYWSYSVYPVTFACRNLSAGVPHLVGMADR